MSDLRTDERLARLTRARRSTFIQAISIGVARLQPSRPAGLADYLEIIGMKRLLELHEY